MLNRTVFYIDADNIWAPAELNVDGLSVLIPSIAKFYIASNNKKSIGKWAVWLEANGAKMSCIHFSLCKPLPQAADASLLLDIAREHLVDPALNILLATYDKHLINVALRVSGQVLVVVADGKFCAPIVCLNMTRPVPAKKIKKPSPANVNVQPKAAKLNISGFGSGNGDLGPVSPAVNKNPLDDVGQRY